MLPISIHYQNILRMMHTSSSPRYGQSVEPRNKLKTPQHLNSLFIRIHFRASKLYTNYMKLEHPLIRIATQWRNYGGHAPPPPPFKPSAPHLTFDCAPFIAMPSSWPPSDPQMVFTPPPPIGPRPNKYQFTPL